MGFSGVVDRERGRIFSITGSLVVGDVGDFSGRGDDGCSHCGRNNPVISIDLQHSAYYTCNGAFQLLTITQHVNKTRSLTQVKILHHACYMKLSWTSMTP